MVKKAKKSSSKEDIETEVATSNAKKSKKSSSKDDIETDADTSHVITSEGPETEATPKKKKKRCLAEGSEPGVEDQSSAPKKKKRADKADIDTSIQDNSTEQETVGAATIDGESEDAKKQQKKASKTEESKDGGSSRKAIFKICVSGLPWHVDEPLLKTDFAECGEVVELKLLTEMHDGQPRSRGIAFIGFSTDDGRQAALKYNGTDYGGRVIKVNPALEREERSKGKGKGKDKGKEMGKGKAKGKPRAPLGEKPEHCTSILVKSLPQDVSEDDLYTFFASCGEGGPTNVRILTSSADKRLAFVDFDDTDVVDQAIKLNATDLKGTPAHLDYSKPRAHKIQRNW